MDALITTHVDLNTPALNVYSHDIHEVIFHRGQKFVLTGTDLLIVKRPPERGRVTPILYGTDVPLE